MKFTGKLLYGRHDNFTALMGVSRRPMGWQIRLHKASDYGERDSAAVVAQHNSMRAMNHVNHDSYHGSPGSKEKKKQCFPDGTRSCLCSTLALSVAE